MAVSIIINVDKNIIQIYNNKDVEFFGKYLINISLKAC